MARFSPFSISISWAGLQALREPPETEHELGEAVALDILGGRGSTALLRLQQILQVGVTCFTGLNSGDID